MSEFQQSQVDFRYTPQYCFIYNNEHLNEDQMTHNASIVFTILMNRFNNFSRNAVAGIVGNMEAESTINPGKWQDDGPALGLVQWDPPTKYSEWADSTGIYGWYDGYGQLDWLNTQTVPYGQWGPTGMYNQTWDQFKKSGASPEYLGKAFLFNFEKPRNAPAKAEYRAQLARKWYDRSIELGWEGHEPEVLPDQKEIPVWLLSLIMRRIK